MDELYGSDNVVSRTPASPSNDSMPALAMTYSPVQLWDAVYEADVALQRGTIFPGLDKPFLEGGCPNE